MLWGIIERKYRLLVQIITLGLIVFQEGDAKDPHYSNFHRSALLLHQLYMT